MAISFIFSVYSWMCEKKYIYTSISIFVHLGQCLGVCVCFGTCRQSVNTINLFFFHHAATLSIVYFSLYSIFYSRETVFL